MKKISTIVFLLLFFFCNAFAALYDSTADFEYISKNLPQTGSIKCKFYQEKYMKNIAKPLVSSGEFEYKENEGVYFYTLSPVKSTTDYTNKNYKQINEIINAISKKKYSKLEKEFNFYYEGNIKKWMLGLKPKENSDAFNYIVSITLEGSDYINKINIQQTNGNKILLWFTK